MSIRCCIRFEIHLSVQAQFQGAGVVYIAPSSPLHVNFLDDDILLIFLRQLHFIGQPDFYEIVLLRFDYSSMVERKSYVNLITVYRCLT
jgi:hypothetical protein